MIITNKSNLPDPFHEACKSEYTYKPKRVSVTTLSASSPRSEILRRRHYNEIIQDCRDMAWLVFGTAVHEILEKYGASFSQIKEGVALYDTPNGYTLSGRFDLYDLEQEKVIDWKTASTWKIIHKSYEDYYKQLLIYCVMLRKMGYPCNKGELVFILKDWSNAQLKLDKFGTYPDFPVQKVEFEFSEEEINQAEEDINKYFLDFEQYEKLADKDLPLCDEAFRTFNGDNVWACTKKGNKRATKCFKESEGGSEEEAQAWVDAQAKPQDFEITLRPKEDKRCLDYCSSSPFCSYFIEHYANYIVVEDTNKIRAGFKTKEEAEEFITTFKLENTCCIIEQEREELN